MGYTSSRHPAAAFALLFTGVLGACVWAPFFMRNPRGRRSSTRKRRRAARRLRLCTEAASPEKSDDNSPPLLVSRAERAQPGKIAAAAAAAAAAGDPGTFLAENLVHAGTILQEQGDPDAALEMFAHAYSIQRQILGSAHPETGATCFAIAELHGSRGNSAQARVYFQLALPPGSDELVNQLIMTADADFQQQLLQANIVEESVPTTGLASRPLV